MIYPIDNPMNYEIPFDDPPLAQKRPKLMFRHKEGVKLKREESQEAFTDFDGSSWI